MKQKVVFFLLGMLFFSCAKTAPELIKFSEVNSLFEKNAVIELNIPKADGNTEQSKAINKTIENHIANMLVFLEEPSDTLQLNYAINAFDSEYKRFKQDFEESAMVWDASFDGEVTYQSSELISIAINSYVNSGGAHGNSNVTFFNFNSSGKLLSFNDLFSNEKGLEEKVKTYFNEETEGNNINYFFGDEFHLPANIGFNDEGVIFFYNVYEIASYADGVTEFTIPFEEIEPYLKLLY
ncbi:MAG: DUF4163 domain-containing protein [Flavobacteriaceae bacterium]